MEVIYLISVLMLLISFILTKKSEKELNIVNIICLSVVTLFCYNAFVCYIFTFFKISITLSTLSLLNIILFTILSIYIIKKKEIQKYKFHKIDLISIVIIAVVVLIISYFNFGYPFNVNYETGDPSTHFIAATMFAKSDALLAAEKEIDQVHGSLQKMKTGSYVNSGLLMKCFCPELDLMKCYNIFVLFGMFTLFLIGTTMYSAFVNYTTKKEHKIWALLISLICLLGYPLNSFLFGFEYLTMGLLIICAIINLVYYYDRNIIKFPYIVILFGLLNFGLFVSYYMFVPFIYTALWMHFYIKNHRETKKILTKKLIILWIVTLLIPFILGYIYHLEPKIYSIFLKETSSVTGTTNKGNTGQTSPETNLESLTESASQIINKGLPTKGYIYINLYSNMLLLLPLTIYLFIKDTKDNNLRNNQFLGLLTLFTISFILFLLFGYKFEKVSMYYLSKNYFALWIVLFFCNYKGLILLSEKHKIFPRILIGWYTIIMILYTIFSNVIVGYYLINPYENIFSVMEVFGANKTIIFEKPIDLNQEELEILKHAKENLDFNSKIEIVADEQSNYWTYALLRYINEDSESKKYRGQKKLNVKMVLVPTKINEVDYIIYFNRTNMYKKCKFRLFINADIIYENEAGGIIKYKK